MQTAAFLLPSLLRIPVTRSAPLPAENLFKKRVSCRLVTANRFVLFVSRETFPAFRVFLILFCSAVVFPLVFVSRETFFVFFPVSRETLP